MSKNAHISEYLKYYIDLPFDPGFAVALTGSWGAGKTHFVDSFLNEHFSSNGDYLCVSLYGLSTAADIDAALLRETYPLLGNKAVKAGGRILKTAISYFQVDLKLSPEDFLALPKVRLYIFDDFERSQIPLDVMMGYLNELVEKDKAKVLIIANESEIKDRESYLRKKEKLIGKTFEIQSEFKSMFDCFSQKISNTKALSCITKNSNLISDIYFDSDLNSLRVLQQTLLDFERFYISLSPEHIESDDATTSMIQIFFSLSFEIKCGRLTAEHIMNMSNYDLSLLNQDSDVKFIAIGDAIKRYKGFNISHSFLSGELLVDVLIKGFVDKQKIYEALASSRFFGYVNEKSWKIVWKAALTPNDKFYESLEDMEGKFRNREYTEFGDIMHVFGLRLWAAKANVLKESFQTVNAQLYRYVDDLYSSGKIEPLMYDIGSAINYESAEYMGFRGIETEEYQEIFDYCKKARLQRGTDVCKEHAASLAELLVGNIPDFCHAITDRKDRNGLGRCAYLQHVDHLAFADALLSLEPLLLDTAVRALASRYDDRYMSYHLKDEAEWLAVLATNLRKKSETDPIDTYRINSLIKWCIEPIFNQDDELKQLYLSKRDN